MILIWQVLAGMSKAWLLKKKVLCQKTLWISHIALPWEKQPITIYVLQVKKSTFTNCFNIRLN